MDGAAKVRIRGIIFALSAGILWGLVPLYIHIIDTDNPLEIVAHRALWSGVLLTFVVGKFGGFAPVWAALASAGARWGAAVCCVMLTVNWILFVYAVQSGQVVEAAFGYFIYPLVSVGLGIVVLGEKLDRWCWVALGFVVVGVAIKGHYVGSLPWLAIWLALTFGFYSVTRKKMGIGPVHGLFIETVILILPALLYIIWMKWDGQAIFFGGGPFKVTLAVLAGVITVMPLLLFHAGNRDLSMIMASLLFYANPTTQLIFGIYFFGAPFAGEELLAFAMIWAGVLVYFTSRKRAVKSQAC